MCCKTQDKKQKKSFIFYRKKKFCLNYSLDTIKKSCGCFSSSFANTKFLDKKKKLCFCKRMGKCVLIRLAMEIPLVPFNFSSWHSIVGFTLRTVWVIGPNVGPVFVTRLWRFSPRRTAIDHGQLLCCVALPHLSFLIWHKSHFWHRMNVNRWEIGL